MVRWEDERQGMWNDNAFIPVTNARGAVVRVIGFAVDITAGKMSEALLRESEERYRTIFEASPEGILVTEIESMRFKYANPAMCAMLGYTLKELQRMRVPDIHPKEALEAVKKHYYQITRGLKITAHAIACRRKDGSGIHVDISGTTLFIDGRECNIGFFTDITERRAIERKLRESEELFRQTFEHAPIGIAIFNSSGAIMNVNSFLADMLGFSKDALKARGIDVLLHAEDRTKKIEMLLDAPEKLHKTAVREKRYVARDGHTAYVKEYAQGIFNKTDELIFVIVLMEDITARIQTEHLNINIIAKLKDVYNELHAFSAILPEHQDFSGLNSINDFKLSSMENRVASMMYQSYANKKIAFELNISENTVKHHVTSIFRKFKVRNRLEFLKIIREKRIII
jgi:PAS domain S-box-containing protein